MNDINLVYDEDGDVLYARFSNSEIKTCNEAPHDYELLICLDEVGDTVGVTVIGFKIIPIENWLAHKDRELIPENILQEVDKFKKML